MNKKFEKNFLPFALPDIGEEEISEVVNTLRTGWVTTGPVSKRFEDDFAKFIGADVQAIAVNSATAGLHLGLEALGVGPGDEVITTTHTFTATAEVIRYLGADPVFVDIDPLTLCIDVDEIEKAVTDKTKVIIPVHFAGRSANMKSILTLAKKHNLYCHERENFANGLLYIEVKINGIYQSETFKDLKKVALEEQMDLLFQYMLDGPKKAKDTREEKEREEKERSDRLAIRNFNSNIVKSQERQYEKALEEVKLYKHLQELKDYIALLQTQISGFSPKEKRLAQFWIQIVQEYAQDADPVTNRLNLLKKIANGPEDKYANYWCKKAKDYTPHEEDAWYDDCDDY
jgi:hypothetical protein